MASVPYLSNKLSMLDSDDLGDDGSVSPDFLYFEGLTVQFVYFDRSVLG